MWDELSQWLEDNWHAWAEPWLDHWDHIAREIATELRDLMETLIEPDPIPPEIRNTAHNNTRNNTRTTTTVDQDEDPLNPSIFIVEEFQVSSLGMGLIVTYRSTSPAQGIGDPSCLYNARSLQLRCAVNPAGPCEGCKHYQHP